MALKYLSPRIVLFAVSFPVVALHIFVFGAVLYDGLIIKPNYGDANLLTRVIKFIFIALMIVFFSDAFLAGTPLISVFVMIGVLLSFSRREFVLSRWTPWSIAALALTILSCPLMWYLNQPDAPPVP